MNKDFCNTVQGLLQGLSCKVRAARYELQGTSCKVRAAKQASGTAEQSSELTWIMKAAGMPARAPCGGQNPVSLLHFALAVASSTTTWWVVRTVGVASPWAPEGQVCHTVMSHAPACSSTRRAVAVLEPKADSVTCSRMRSSPCCAAALNTPPA